MAGVFNYTLPAQAKNQAGAATTAKIQDALVSNVWQTSIDKNAASDTVAVLAPFMGKLHVETVAGTEQFVLDASAIAWVTTDARLFGETDALLPIPVRCVVRGLDAQGFQPVKAAKRLKK